MNKYILIDVDDIIINNRLYNLMNRLSFTNVDNRQEYRRAIVVGVFPDVLRQLNDLQSSERLQYINSDQFIFNTHALLLCNGDLCEIYHMSDLGMIPFLIRSVNPNATFWISVNSTNTYLINELVSQGFTSPFTCKISPFHNSVSDDTICLLRPPQALTHDVDKVMNDIKHVLHQQKRGICNITIQFTPNTIEYLRRIPMQNGTEIAGALQIIGNRRIQNKIIYNIEVNHNTVVEGEDELVRVLNDKYNFHTHPRDAYIRQGVNHAWPSDHDFLGFLKAVFYSNSVFHVVVTLEGVYIISISPEYSGNINKLKSQQEYISHAYQIPHDSFKTPEEYISHVNQLKVFNVEYLSWKNSIRPFTVYYPKNNGSCLV